MNTDDIRKNHPMSLRGVFNRYILVKIIKSTGTIISLIFALLFVVFLYVYCDSMNELYKFLGKTTDILLSLLPNLLGFCIGGYALIIGACSMEIIKKMSTPLDNNKNKLSFYQILSSVFASTLIIQCFTLLLTYLVHLFILLELKTSNELLGYAINILLVFILVLFSFLSISLLYYTVINIFNLGQSVHFCVRLNNNNNNEL